MARKLLFCFIHLAILPGCRQFSEFRAVPTTPTSTSREDVPVGQVRQHSAALDPVKEPVTPPAVPMLEILPPYARDRKPTAAGASGTVSIETEAATTTLQPVAAQNNPPALPVLVNHDPDKTKFAPAVIALQCMLDGRPPEAMKHLRAYDDATQEFLLRLLPPLAQFVKKPIAEMTPPEIANLIDQLTGLHDELKKRSELVIGKMCYCKRVRGFGQYDPLPDNHAFVTKTENRPGDLVQLYFELKNFASERPAKDSDYLTKLACRLDIHDASGNRVWSHTFPREETSQERRTRWHDFHGNCRFYVPALATGAYQLTLHVVDETIPDAPRRAHKSLDFRVTPVANQAQLR